MKKNNKKQEVAQVIEQPKEVVEVKEVAKTKRKRYHKPKAKQVVTEVEKEVIEEQPIETMIIVVEEQPTIETQEIEVTVERKVPFLIRIKNLFNRLFA